MERCGGDHVWAFGCYLMGGVVGVTQEEEESQDIDACLVEPEDKPRPVMRHQWMRGSIDDSQVSKLLNTGKRGTFRTEIQLGFVCPLAMHAESVTRTIIHPTAAALGSAVISWDSHFAVQASSGVRYLLLCIFSPVSRFNVAS